jgi:hypothetical protein
VNSRPRQVKLSKPHFKNNVQTKGVGAWVKVVESLPSMQEALCSVTGTHERAFSYLHLNNIFKVLIREDSGLFLL